MLGNFSIDTEGLFEALADTLPALVRICDSTGSSIWFNKEWLTFRGRTVEQESGAGWLDGLHPKDVEGSLDILSHRFAERAPYETKYRLRHYSGQYRWVLHKAAPRFDATGAFLGFITACIDVHDATIADFERQQFFNVASDILITSDQAGYIGKVSSACERVLGWTAEEITQFPLSDLLHPEDLTATLATAEILSNGGELVGFENRYRHKDGSYRWLSWRARRDEEAGTIYGSAVDITERKAFEAELQETIDRYNLAISATSDGIWDWNVLTDELQASPRWTEMLGFCADYPAPRTAAEWRSHLHPDDREATIDAYQAYLDGKSQDYRATFRMKHANGEWRTILSRGVALREQSGQAYRMIGVHTDITEQRQMEDSLRRLRDEAELANRAKTDFLANMSHEIRTPMNAVIGAAQLLGMGGSLNDRQQKLVDILKNSAHGLMDLLNDFLDLSKIESGNLQFENVQFDARHLVAEVVQLLAVQVQAKGLVLNEVNDCACVDERLFVGDPARIRQLLLNLCTNAVKFTEQGSVSVHISCRPSDVDEVEDLTFIISDTGIGIAQDKVASIFDKFEQADSTITRRFGGTGLGLSIVKALVDAMKGEIHVESEPGKGSIFTVHLPLRRGGAIVGKTGSTRPSNAAAGEKPKVLLVEDLPANVLIAQHFLDAFGYRYEIATDGQQAVDRIEAGQDYDAILMDIQMPGMDGREATRRIRAFEQATGRAPLQIIAVTAHAMIADRQRCLDAGMDDYLSKPFDAKILEQKIVRAVALRRKSEDRFLGEVGTVNRTELNEVPTEGATIGERC